MLFPSHQQKFHFSSPRLSRVQDKVRKARVDLRSLGDLEWNDLKKEMIYNHPTGISAVVSQPISIQPTISVLVQRTVLGQLFGGAMVAWTNQRFRIKYVMAMNRC